MARKPISNETEMALINQKLDAVLKKTTEIEAELKSQAIDVSAIALIRLELANVRLTMVTQDQYWPVKMAVYGFIGMILTGAIGSILALIYTGSKR